MRSVSITNRQKFYLSIFLFLAFTSINAQENSPFSRYGLGDIYPSQNIINRAMGGITATYLNSNSVNFNNP